MLRRRCRNFGQNNFTVLDFVAITHRNFTTAFVPGFQLREFSQKQCGLHLVQARIDALKLVDILDFGAVISKRTDDTSNIGVVSHDHPCIAKRPQILGRIKAKCGCGAKRTGGTAIAKTSSMSLRTVFEQQQVMRIGELANLVHIAQASVQMHHEDAAGSCTEGFLNTLRINIATVFVRLYQYRLESDSTNGKD